jgi:hypothetical protein
MSYFLSNGTFSGWSMKIMKTVPSQSNAKGFFGPAGSSVKNSYALLSEEASNYICLVILHGRFEDRASKI